MRWLMETIGRLWHGGFRAPSVDQEALRDEMARDDPEFARVRQVQHDARGLLGALGNAEQLRERRIRTIEETWRRGDART